jgi:hypothetical protein
MQGVRPLLCLLGLWAQFIILDITDLILYTYTNRQIPRHVHSKVHIVTPRCPCWPRGRSAVRVFCRDAFNVLEGELALEFGLERGQGADQLSASLLEGSSWCNCSIRLNFHQKIWVERVRDLVASEKNLWHGKELAKENKRGHAGEGSNSRVERTHPRTMFASV